MTIDPSPLITRAATWQPNIKWEATVRPAYEALLTSITGLDRSKAWSEIAMMMGDTHAAPLALVVCLNAERELGDALEDRRLTAHKQLCLLDLGLAHAAGPVRFRCLGDPDVVATEVSSLEAWLVRALMPFDGDLKRAAWFALRVACRRTGVLGGDEPTP